MSSIRPSFASHIDQGSTSSSSFFEQRSFRRLVAILGIGSAVALAYSAFKKHLYPIISNAELFKDVESAVAVPTVLQSKEPQHEETVAVNENEETETTEELTKNDKVILFQVPRGFFTPVVSPFALKLETFLRVAKIEHEVQVSSELETPSWIKVGDEEVKIHTDCIKFLTARFNVDLTVGSTSSRRTAARLVDTLFESKIACGVALWRWIYDSGKSMKDIQAFTPPSESILASIKESVIRAAQFQGMGRLSEEEVVAIIEQALTDAAAALGKHKYFLGNSPGEVDCNVFSLLAQMVWNMPGSPFEKAIKKQPQLMDYVVRMRDNYWPDWQDLILQTRDLKEKKEKQLVMSLESTIKDDSVAGNSEPQQETQFQKSLSRMTTVPESMHNVQAQNETVGAVQNTNGPQNSKEPQQESMDIRSTNPTANTIQFPPTKFRSELNAAQEVMTRLPQQRYIPPMQPYKMQLPSYSQMPQAYSMAPPPQQIFYPGVSHHSGQYPGGRVDYMSPMTQVPPQYTYASNSPVTVDPYRFEDLKRATEAVLKPITPVQDSTVNRNQSQMINYWQ